MESIFVKSSKRNELIDINQQVEDIVAKSGIKEGICHVYAPHATCGVIINENYDPNICLDILDCLREHVPGGRWRHDRIDSNADSHIKATIVGPSETIPISDGRLVMGTWQSIMLADFDGPRERRIVVTVIKGQVC